MSRVKSTNLTKRARLLAPFAAGLMEGSSPAAAPHASRPIVETPRLPPRAIMILVAWWCAPCRGELARLDAIAAAARGRTLRVLAIDDSPATGRMLRMVNPDHVWHPGAQAGDVRAALLARTSGLPFSIATDARGVICAEENGGLNAARTAALIARCTAP